MNSFYGSSFFDKRQIPNARNNKPKNCNAVINSFKITNPNNDAKNGVASSKAETWAALILFSPS